MAPANMVLVRPGAVGSAIEVELVDGAGAAHTAVVTACAALLLAEGLIAAARRELEPWRKKMARK